MLPSDLAAAAGTPSNLGKVSADSGQYLDVTFSFIHSNINYVTALADADPLGVNVNVTFEEVGGLDDRELHHYLCFVPILRKHARYYVLEGNDFPTSAIPRSFPTVQNHSPTRCTIPWSTRYW